MSVVALRRFLLEKGQDPGTGTRTRGQQIHILYSQHCFQIQQLYFKLSFRYMPAFSPVVTYITKSTCNKKKVCLPVGSITRHN